MSSGAGGALPGFAGLAPADGGAADAASVAAALATGRVEALKRMGRAALLLAIVRTKVSVLLSC